MKRFAGKFESGWQWRGAGSALLLFSLIAPAAPASPKGEARPDWSSWGLKVGVVRLDGVRELGFRGDDRAATGHYQLPCGAQCPHDPGVARHGSLAGHDGSRGRVRDLCFLRVPGYPGEVPRMAEPGDAKVGLDVFAVGFPGGNFAVSKGGVKGLFSCACDGGRVSQASAHFDPGASGGGLFDSTGRLLGILTYKSGSGGDFHFAMPIGWMKQLSRIPPQPSRAKPPSGKAPPATAGIFSLPVTWTQNRTGAACCTSPATGHIRNPTPLRPGWPGAGPI